MYSSYRFLNIKNTPPETSGGVLHAALDIPHKNYKLCQVGHTVIVKKWQTKKPYKSTSPRGLLTCKALISSYNLDIIILFVLRFMPRSLNFVPARLTLADFAMFFAIEIITSRTNNVFAKPLSSIFFDNIILCSIQKN